MLFRGFCRILEQFKIQFVKFNYPVRDWSRHVFVSHTQRISGICIFVCVVIWHIGFLWRLVEAMEQDVTRLFFHTFQFANKRVVNLANVTPLQINVGDKTCCIKAMAQLQRNTWDRISVIKWQTWQHYEGMPRIRYVTQGTGMTSLASNTRDQICYSNNGNDTITKGCRQSKCYSNDWQNTTTKDCRGSDMLLKWQTWHHYKGLPGIRYVTQMTDITPLQRLPGIRYVTQMTDITPLQRMIAGDQICYSNDRHNTTTKIAGDQICYSNDRHNTTTKDDCRGSDTLLKWQT